MQVTIYRGTHEIGGNCVEFCAGSTRIVVDVGMPLVDANGESFDAKSLYGKSVPELIADGTLPKVPGLFDDRPTPDAILLSHAHCDHTGLLTYTRKEIPVWLSPGTSDMMYVGLKFARQAGVGRKRQCKFKPKRPFQIGECKVTAFAVDHSAFDSMAFLIEAEGKRILYSGDLRLHGRKPGMARGLIAAVTEKPLDVLMIEGTHAVPAGKPRITEWDLEKEIAEHIRPARGVVLTNFSPLHVDRLVGFYRAAVHTGRVFVADPYAATVMHKAAKRCGVPDPAEEPSIRVYYNRYFEDAYKAKRLRWVHDLFQANRITLEEILAEPSRFLMVFRPNMIEPEFHGTLPQCARCIYSYWAGYLKQPQWAELQEKLKAVGGDFVTAHTSGHILPDDIVEFIGQLEPRTVIPIHTFEPTYFQSIHDRVVILQNGQPYEIV